MQSEQVQKELAAVRSLVGMLKALAVEYEAAGLVLEASHHRNMARQWEQCERNLESLETLKKGTTDAETS